MSAAAKPIPAALDASGPTVRRILDRFEVVGVSGITSPMFPSRRMAERWLAAQIAAMPEGARPGMRPCMCCGTAFPSDGRHHRLCKDCRHRDAGPVAMVWARPQRRGDGASR